MDNINSNAVDSMNVIFSRYQNPAVTADTQEHLKKFYTKFRAAQLAASGHVEKNAKNTYGRGFEYSSEAAVYPVILSACAEAGIAVALTAWIPTESWTPSSISSKGETMTAEKIVLMVIQIVDTETGYWQYFIHQSSLPPQTYKSDNVQTGNVMMGQLTRGYRTALCKIFMTESGEKDPDSEVGSDKSAQTTEPKTAPVAAATPAEPALSKEQQQILTTKEHIMAILKTNLKNDNEIRAYVKKTLPAGTTPETATSKDWDIVLATANLQYGNN